MQVCLCVLMSSRQLAVLKMQLDVFHYQCTGFHACFHAFYFISSRCRCMCVPQSRFPETLELK